MRPKVSPKYQHLCDGCECLGYATINDKTADLFVCGDLVIARFSDDPDDYEAVHLRNITAESDVFLLTAFRLYLDVQERKFGRNGISDENRLQG